MSRRRERSECPTPNRKGPPMPALSLVRSYSSFQGWPGEENHEARGSLCVGEVGRDKGRTDVGEQPGLLAMDPQPCAHSLGLPGCPHPLLSKHAPVCQGLSKTAQPPRVLGNRRLTGQAPLASCGPSFPGCSSSCLVLGPTVFRGPRRQSPGASLTQTTGSLAPTCWRAGRG